MTNERALKGVSGKMNLGGQYSYAVDALMKKERVGNAHKYSPSLEIKLPNTEPVSVSGMFMYNGNRQFDVKFNMDKITEKPLEASGISIALLSQYLTLKGPRKKNASENVVC